MQRPALAFTVCVPPSCQRCTLYRRHTAATVVVVSWPSLGTQLPHISNVHQQTYVGKESPKSSIRPVRSRCAAAAAAMRIHGKSAGIPCAALDGHAPGQRPVCERPARPLRYTVPPLGRRSVAAKSPLIRRWFSRWRPARPLRHPAWPLAV